MEKLYQESHFSTLLGLGCFKQKKRADSDFAQMGRNAYPNG